jgi:hypothetical protein
VAVVYTAQPLSLAQLELSVNQDQPEYAAAVVVSGPESLRLDGRLVEG